MVASRWSAPIPRLTWVRCECGCGFEGEDEVVQFLLEEALAILVEGDEAIAELGAVKEREISSAIEQATVAAKAALQGG